MGAGKSTIGPALAERLGWRFVDADHHLQARAGKTIAEIFAEAGEPVFRQMETETVAELMAETDIVIAFGGGALEAESTRHLLEHSCDTVVVFLKAPLEVLIERCEQQPGAATRPVLLDREALRHRFRARQPHYEQAHVTVHTEGFSAAAVADRILQSLCELESQLAERESQKAIAI
jgi:shikimate kinase